MSSGFANNKGADQLAHLCSLTRAFVIGLKESIIFKLAKSEIPLFYLVSIAEQADLGMTWSIRPMKGLSCAAAPLFYP